MSADRFSCGACEGTVDDEDGGEEEEEEEEETNAEEA